MRPTTPAGRGRPDVRSLRARALDDRHRAADAGRRHELAVAARARARSPASARPATSPRGSPAAERKYNLPSAPAGDDLAVRRDRDPVERRRQSAGSSRRRRRAARCAMSRRSRRSRPHFPSGVKATPLTFCVWPSSTRGAPPASGQSRTYDPTRRRRASCRPARLRWLRSARYGLRARCLAAACPAVQIAILPSAPAVTTRPSGS